MLVLMINSSASQLQKSTFGLEYLQKREIYCMIIITMVALPSNSIYTNLQETWNKNVLVQNILFEMRISEEFIKDRNEKSVLNSCLTFKKPLKELWACAVKSMIYSNCLEYDG